MDTDNFLHFVHSAREQSQPSYLKENILSDSVKINGLSKKICRFVHKVSNVYGWGVEGFSDDTAEKIIKFMLNFFKASQEMFSISEDTRINRISSKKDKNLPLSVYVSQRPGVFYIKLPTIINQIALSKIRPSIEVDLLQNKKLQLRAMISTREEQTCQSLFEKHMNGWLRFQKFSCVVSFIEKFTIVNKKQVVIREFSTPFVKKEIRSSKFRVQFLKQIANALTAFHKERIIYGGVILEDLQVVDDRVKMLYFTKIFDLESPQEDLPLYSLGYFAPEVFQLILLKKNILSNSGNDSSLKVDCSLDIWAFGCLLYQMLNNSEPLWFGPAKKVYEGCLNLDRFERTSRKRKLEPKTISIVNPDCLRKEIDQSHQEYVDAIEQYRSKIAKEKSVEYTILQSCLSPNPKSRMEACLIHDMLCALFKKAFQSH